MEYRTLKDGSILFTKSTPPKRIKNYTVDPENPNHFIPNWDSCQLRSVESKLKPGCGCLVVLHVCSLKGVIGFSDCEGCTERQPK